MTSVGTGYDLTSSQFSPEGKIFQIEYAHKAVDNSGTAIALKCKDGIVLAVENIITSQLYEPGCIKRIYHVDKHIGIAVSGFLADARALVEHIRKECQNYSNEYGKPISAERLAERISMYIHAHTLYSSVRPFGVSIIIASFEEDKPHIYMIEPSGLYFSYSGCAIGKAKQNAKTEIEKLKTESMSMNDLLKEASKIIYTVHDEIKDKRFDLDLSWVGKNTKGSHEVVPKNVHDEAEAYAKQALADADELDDDME